MALGVWEPTKKNTVLATVDRRLVLEILDRVQNQDAQDLESLLGDDLCRRGAQLMQQPEEVWKALADLPEPDIECLVRFFTLAEVQLAGWQAGKKSPVIALVKLLRERNAFSTELRRWIKQHTENRYLPYGSA